MKLRKDGYVKSINQIPKALFAFCFFSLLLMSSCTDAKETNTQDAYFKDYWYRGKAELTRFELEQERYGEIRKGDAVLIFVTEDFFEDKHVKHEFGEGDNTVSVLKLNFTRNFTTGIYPYSIMTSTFTPVSAKESPLTLKTSTTVQEWCGHTFQQLNLNGGGYDAQIRSYFQREGDEDIHIKAKYLEDEIWTKIRINPAMLPVGEIKIVPGSQFIRLSHKELKSYKAEASLDETGETAVYSLEYKDIERKLTIKFQNEPPYKILGWEETSPSVFDKESKPLVTKAVSTHSIMLDYWKKNRLEDGLYRKLLGLE